MIQSETIDDIKANMRIAEQKIVEAIISLEQNGALFKELEIERIEITSIDHRRRTFTYRAHIKTEITSDE